MGVFFLYSYAFVIKIIYANVTHTLMESCCVEEFFPSAEIEGIWGFTRAIAMVGGVSLVIFFSLFKRMDLGEEKKSANGRQSVKSSNKHTEAMPLDAVLCQTCIHLGLVFVKQSKRKSMRVKKKDICRCNYLITLLVSDSVITLMFITEEKV